MDGIFVCRKKLQVSPRDIRVGYEMATSGEVYHLEIARKNPPGNAQIKCSNLHCFTLYLPLGYLTIEEVES